MESSRLSVTFLCLIVGLSACSFRKGGDEDKISAADVKVSLDNMDRERNERSESSISEKNVSFEFIADKEPHRYFLEIRWPATVSKIEIFLDDTFLDEVSGNQTYRIPVKDARKYRLVVQSKMKNGDLVSVVTKDLLSPKDVVVGSSLTLSEDLILEARRVFFESGVSIDTQGYNLRIEAAEIHFDSLRVMTFDKITQSRDPRALTNGLITFAAKKMSGYVEVSLVGLNGQDGRDGKDLVTPSMNLGPGAAGAPGRAAKIGKTPETCNRGMCYPSIEYCLFPPTSGDPGGRGSDGLNGQAGQDGGNSGHLHFIVEDYSGLSVDAFVRPGEGGRGGKGMPGFPGGPGGPAGATKEPCPSLGATAGPDGQHGDPGRDGAEGKLGAEGTIILPKGPGSEIHFRIRSKQ